MLQHLLTNEILEFIMAIYSLCTEEVTIVCGGEEMTLPTFVQSLIDLFN
jgi:hypothetical protein